MESIKDGITQELRFGCISEKSIAQEWNYIIPRGRKIYEKRLAGPYTWVHIALALKEMRDLTEVGRMEAEFGYIPNR